MVLLFLLRLIVIVWDDVNNCANLLTIRLFLLSDWFIACAVVCLNPCTVIEFVLFMIKGILLYNNLTFGICPFSASCKVIEDGNFIVMLFVISFAI